MLGTPQKSRVAVPPLATIGGRLDGRGGIVVEDYLGQAPDVPPQAEKTTVDPGRAEPGRDILAQPPQPDIMSQEKADPAPAENDEPKAISSVGFPSDSEASEAAADKPLSDAQSSAMMGTTQADSKAEKPKAQGPPNAEQGEACVNAAKILANG
jgi:hypothetical protein